MSQHKDKKMKKMKKMKDHPMLNGEHGHHCGGHHRHHRHGGEGMEEPGGHRLGSMIHKVARMMSRAHHHQDHARHAQGRVMEILHREGPMKQRELLEVLDVRSSSLSELLGKLERKGVVTRERDPEDGRGFIVSARETDPSETAKARQSHGSDDPFAALSEEEQEVLAGLLGKLIVAMKKDFKKHGHGRGMHHPHRGHRKMDEHHGRDR